MYFYVSQYYFYRPGLNINLHISTSSAQYITSLLHGTVASKLVLPNNVHKIQCVVYC